MDPKFPLREIMQSYKCLLHVSKMSTEQTVSFKEYRSTQTHWPDSEPTTLCFLNAAYLVVRSNIYQLHSLWFDLTGAWTQDLLHSRQIGSVIFIWLHTSLLINFLFRNICIVIVVTSMTFDQLSKSTPSLGTRD